MSRATPKMRDFASRLIAYETRGKKTAANRTTGAFPVCEKLRPHLTTLVGNNGYGALFSRALTLASMEVPWLRAVQVKTAGVFEGLEEARAQLDPREFLEGEVVLVAQLLG